MRYLFTLVLLLVASDVQAAITVGTATTATPSATDTFTCDKPTGVSNGDVLVAWVNADFRTVTTPPTGWTLVDSDVSQARPKSYCYTKAITDAGSEPATYSWVLSGSDGGAMAIVSLTGAVDNATNDFESATALANAVSSFDSPAVTPSDADSVVLRAVFAEDGPTTVPGDETELVAIALSALESLSVSYFTHGTSSTGTNAFAVTNATGNVIGITIAVAPSASGGPAINPISSSIPGSSLDPIRTTIP